MRERQANMSDIRVLDKRYQDRRRRNNEAVRRCRENKRARLLGRAEVTDRLHSENQTLRSELTDLSHEVKALRKLLSSDNSSGSDRSDLLKTLRLATSPVFMEDSAQEMMISQTKEVERHGQANASCVEQSVSSSRTESPAVGNCSDSSQPSVQTSISPDDTTIKVKAEYADKEDIHDFTIFRTTGSDTKSKDEANVNNHHGDATVVCLNRGEMNSLKLNSDEPVDFMDNQLLGGRTNGFHHQHNRMAKGRRRYTKRNDSHISMIQQSTVSNTSWSDFQPSSNSKLLKTCDYLSSGVPEDAISS